MKKIILSFAFIISLITCLTITGVINAQNIPLLEQWLPNTQGTQLSPRSETSSILIGGSTTSTAEFVFDVWNGRATATTDFCLASGKCLSTGGGGTYNYTSSWEQLFPNAITPTSSTAGIFVNASSTFDSILRVNGGLIVNSNATTTGNSLIGNTLYVKDGRVGIGTASPASTLHIVGNARLDGTSDKLYLGSTAIYIANAGWTSNRNVGITVGSTYKFTVESSALVVMGSDGSGNVGIATTTPGGYYGEKLTVAGGAYITGGATTTALRVASLNVNGDDISDITGSGLAVVNGALSVQGFALSGSTGAWETAWANTLTPTSTSAGIFVKASSTFDSTLRVNSGLIVNSNATTTGNSLIGNTLYVKDSNVGIGTANPNSKFEIYNSAGAGSINLSGNGSDTYNFDSLTMYDTGGKYWAIHHRNTDGGVNNLLFEHYDGANYNGYMTINPDGHIIAPNLRATSLNASSTLISTLNFTNATGTNLHVGELCLTNDCKTSWPVGGGGSSAWEQIWANALTPTSTTAGIFVKASSTFISNLRVANSTDFGGWDAGDGLFNIESNSPGSAVKIDSSYPGVQDSPLFYINYTGGGSGANLFRIDSNSASSQEQIRLQGLTVGIEMVETDQTNATGKGKWEMYLQHNKLGWGSRSQADDGFQKMIGWSQAQEGGAMILPDPDVGEWPEFSSRFGIVGINTNTTTDYFSISTDTNPSGGEGALLKDIFLVNGSGQVGIASSTPYAGSKLAVVGATYINGAFKLLGSGSSEMFSFNQSSGNGWIAFREGSTITGYVGFSDNGGLANGLANNTMIVRSQGNLVLTTNGNHPVITATTGYKVGIGDNFSSPTSTLDILGTLNVNGGATTTHNFFSAGYASSTTGFFSGGLLNIGGATTLRGITTTTATTTIWGMKVYKPSRESATTCLEFL